RSIHLGRQYRHELLNRSGIAPVRLARSGWPLCVNGWAVAVAHHESLAAPLVWAAQSLPAQRRLQLVARPAVRTDGGDEHRTSPAILRMGLRSYLTRQTRQEERTTMGIPLPPRADFLREGEAIHHAGALAYVNPLAVALFPRPDAPAHGCGPRKQRPRRGR